MKNQQEKLTLECYLQIKQSQKLIIENLFKSKSKYFQNFPEIYYQLTSINVLIPLLNLDLDDLEASILETLIQKITQDPHRSWVTFLWIVPEGYQESFEAYLDFIAPDLGNASLKDYQMQVLDLPTLQHYWSTIDTRIDAYWHISTFIDQEFVCWNPEDQYANYFINLPKILWSDDRPVTACLYESLLQKIEQLDIEAKKAFDRSNWGEAIDLYETIVSLNPLNPNNWANLGSSYLKQGNYQEAKECVEQAIVLNPNQQTYLNTLGLIYENLKQYEQAITSYKNAIKIAPKEGISYCNLGNLLAQLSQYSEAEKVYQQGLEVNPWYYGLYLNLGNLWVLTGKNTEAIGAYKKVEYFTPNDPDLYLNMSIAYKKDNPVLSQYYYATSLKIQGQYQEALSIYENIIQTNPLCPSNYEPEVHIDYLGCFKALGYENSILEEKIKNTITLLTSQKNITEISLLFIRRLLGFLNNKGEHEKSRALVRELNLLSVSEFNELFAQLNLPVLYQTESEILTYRQKFMEILVKANQINTMNANFLEEGYTLTKALLNFYTPYQNFNDLPVQQNISNFIHKFLTQKHPTSSRIINSASKTQTQKIKIGYISSYFQAHSGTIGILGWIGNHNPEKFEYFLYHLGSVLDLSTQKFVNASDYFHHICLQDFLNLDQWLEVIIKTIQNDNLDILVFTDVGMDIKSTLLSRLRLAPIQCLLWGHPVTTGSATMDYFLTASLMEPDDAHLHYSERLVHLPNISWSYPTVELPEEKKLRSDFDLPDDRILYFSCQSLFKYLPQHDYIYATIAQRVPQAYFMFLDIFEVRSIFWKRLQKAFAAVDLDVNDFCKILPRQSYPNFLALQGLSDIYLDTLSWSGGNTTIQALACAIPVVTCPNQFMRGRHSYGILQTLGVTETIAHNESEYIDIACELGLNPQWRSSVVEKIKSRNHRLYNDLQCVQAVETFFEYAYEKYQDDMIQQP